MEKTEKDHVFVENAAEGQDGHLKAIVEQRGAAIGEATDIYGDIQTAEAYGYVNRG